VRASPITPTVPMGEQHREDLGGLAIEVGGDQLFEHDLVGVAQEREASRM